MFPIGSSLCHTERGYLGVIKTKVEFPGGTAYGIRADILSTQVCIFVKSGYNNYYWEW